MQGMQARVEVIWYVRLSHRPSRSNWFRCRSEAKGFSPDHVTRNNWRNIETQELGKEVTLHCVDTNLSAVLTCMRSSSPGVRGVGGGEPPLHFQKRSAWISQFIQVSKCTYLIRNQLRVFSIFLFYFFYLLWLTSHMCKAFQWPAKCLLSKRSAQNCMYYSSNIMWMRTKCKHTAPP